LSNTLKEIANGFKYGEFATIEISYYKKNSCSRYILLGYRPISYVNSTPQRAHGLRANALGAA
jgi:hypothetical protein